MTASAPVSVARLAAATVCTVALALTVVYATLRAVAPPPAPTEIRAGAPIAPAFTKHLVLVIVDGLRYDIATDREKMPHFSREMESRTSGAVWAGQVSMTSSAVLSIGTGQRGRLEQVIRNVSSDPPAFNSWFENAHHYGLRASTVGDPAWVQMYAKSLAEQRLDPEGVAIDVDFNSITFRSARELLAHSPEMLVLHFGTPDHQGHAYGIRSERYVRHIRSFDGELAALLAEIPPDRTVIVTSDHGAADSGTHGSDTPLQRRSPFYAYGPGIVSGAPLHTTLDQLDLSATLPVLLGVPPPAHGLGHVSVDLFETDDASRARIATENANRVLAYAENVTGTAALLPARSALSHCTGDRECILAAEHAVRTAEAAVTANTGLASPATNKWLAAIAALTLLSILLVIPNIGLGTVAGGAALVAVTVFLVMHVERLPSFWPNSVRAPLFALGNAPLLALLLFPSRAAAWLGRRRALLPVLAPAALAVCYPADARVEAFIVGAMLSLVLLGYGPLQDRLGTWLRGFRPAVPRLDTAVALLSLLALLPTLLHEGDTYSSVLRPPSLRDAVATPAAFLAGGWLARRATRAPWKIFAVAALSAAIPWLRPVLSPILGRGAVLTSIAVFVTLLRRGESRAAIVAGVFGVALVSRQFESIPVLAVVCLASVVGDAVAAGSPVPRQSWPVNAALVLTLHVALAYLFRLGVQDGLDFGGMFWGAGAFNDPHVSAFTIGAALFFKYAMGVLLAGLALRPALLTGSAFFARACFAAFALRVLSLFAQFSLAGGSFWTAMRVIGDLPTAVAMCGGALAFVAIERMLAVRSGAVAHAPPDVAVGVPSS